MKRSVSPALSYSPALFVPGAVAAGSLVPAEFSGVGPPPCRPVLAAGLFTPVGAPVLARSHPIMDPAMAEEIRTAKQKRSMFGLLVAFWFEQAISLDYASHRKCSAFGIRTKVFVVNRSLTVYIKPEYASGYHSCDGTSARMAEAMMSASK